MLIVVLTLLAPRATFAQSTTQAQASASPVEPAPAPALDPRLARKQRQARMLLAAGVSLTASALTFATWASLAPGPCSYDEARARGPTPSTLASASIIGAIGIAFTFGGGFSLAATKRVADYPMLKRHRAGAVGLGIGVFAVSHALLGIVRLGAADLCAS